MGDTAADLGHAGDGEEVVDGAHVLEVARERVVPGGGVRALGQVLVQLELEAGGFDGGDALGDGHHVGDAVALLDAEADLAVVLVVVVVLVGHEPLVDAKDAAGLEHAVDLAVDALQRGGVHSGLDGVDAVEGVIREGHLLHDVRALFKGRRDVRNRRQTMKSPLTNFNWSERPSFAAYRVARSIW